MSYKHCIVILLIIAAGLGLMTGCGTKPTSKADLSLTQRDISTITLPKTVQIAALGEASHGVHEYQQMKADVFKALVHNNGCRTFIIEGDFGGALKVDAYIHGAAGTAENAAAAIGFNIYRTREMAELIDWMRAYNQTAPIGQDLHFYGMDVQRFDNNKAYVLDVLETAAPELAADYQTALAPLTDASRNTLDTTALTQGRDNAEALLADIDAAKSQITAAVGANAFAFARECAASIRAYCDIQLSDDYNATREQYQFEKVTWFIDQGDGSLLFINGHNGHIAKTSTAGYTSLGEKLDQMFGDAYYAIATDAQITTFNSQKDDGSFEIIKVTNTNHFNAQLSDNDAPYFIDFDTAKSDSNWQHIITSEQSLTTLNVGLSPFLRFFKPAYTITMTPEAAFDAMLVFHSVTPTTLNG